MRLWSTVRIQLQNPLYVPASARMSRRASPMVTPRCVAGFAVAMSLLSAHREFRLRAIGRLRRRLRLQPGIEVFLRLDDDSEPHLRVIEAAELGALSGIAANLVAA